MDLRIGRRLETGCRSESCIYVHKLWFILYFLDKDYFYNFIVLTIFPEIYDRLFVT